MNARDRIRTSVLLVILVSALLLAACTRTSNDQIEPWKAGQGFVLPTSQPDSQDNSFTTNPRDPDQPIISPTPDAPHPIPGARTDVDQYRVQPGDTLGLIANRFGVSVDAIAEASGLTDINLISVGQELVIPPPDPVDTGPSFKIIPDSELIASPATVSFDPDNFKKGVEKLRSLGYLE